MREGARAPQPRGARPPERLKSGQRCPGPRGPGARAAWPGPPPLPPPAAGRPFQPTR